MTSETTPPVIHLQVVDSTNDETFRLAEQGAEHLTAVMADYQTAGRGQPGHHWWMSARQGILLSVLFRKLPGGIEFSDLTLHVGYRLAQAIEDSTGLSIQIKLPNDLMIQGKKVGGVLGEARWRGDELVCVVIGVGINVNVTEFPEELSGSAVSLAKAAGRQFDLDAISTTIIATLRGL